MNKFYLIIFIFFFSQHFHSQNFHLEILNRENKPYPGVQVYTDLGNLLGLSNTEGVIEFNKKELIEMNVEKIILKTDVTDVYEYSLENIPKTIQLIPKEKVIDIPEVILTKKSNDFFIVRGFIRSWQLHNNRLVKYGDGIVEYHIPYDSIKNKKNIRSYILNYRTFTADSISKKTPFIRITFNPEFFSTRIPETDVVTTYPEFYKKVLIKDSLYSIERRGEKAGYLILDRTNKPIEIQISSSFNKDELKDIKFGFWKISGADQTIQKWKNFKKYRYPQYILNNFKFLVKDKKGIKKDMVEILTEIFIEDFSSLDKKPTNYKLFNPFQSYYKTKFWMEKLEKYPLPERILQQLQNLKENQNVFK